MTVRVYLELSCTKAQAEKILKNTAITSRAHVLEHRNDMLAGKYGHVGTLENFDVQVKNTLPVSKYIFLGEESPRTYGLDDD